jgi:putative transposase
MTETTPSPLGNVITIDDERIRSHLDRVVRGSVEETLNALLDAEADRLCNAQRYERSEARRDTRAGHYERNLQTKAGEVRLKIPKLRQQTFETAIIERYRRRESSVEEALIEMYLAGVSVRRVEDITEALWGTRVSPSTVSELNKKIYGTIEAWRNRPIAGEHPYVYLDGIVLKRSWAGEVRNVSLLVSIGVNSDGYREILGICEGAKEDKAGWSAFLKHLKERGLRGVQLIISDACLGLSESAAEFFPEAAWQRCVVHWYRNIFSHVPSTKVREIAAMLKAIHAGEDIVAAREKAVRVIEKLHTLRLTKAAELVEAAAEETLTYYAFPEEHWRRIRTNNPLERILREIRRRTRVVGSFPDGQSALNLAAARLRHIAGTAWSTKRYLNIEMLKDQQMSGAAQPKPNVRKTLDTTKQGQEPSTAPKSPRQRHDRRTPHLTATVIGAQSPGVCELPVFRRSHP